MVADIVADIGLDFHDAFGFGDSVGEAVLSLSLSAGATFPTFPSDTATAAAAAASVGGITVTNDLDPHSIPAVLAPITDQLGTINWDFGPLGTSHNNKQTNNNRDTSSNSSSSSSTDQARQYGDDVGVLDVTTPPFNADCTGNVDATLALQAAIDFAAHNYLALYLPAGKYVVTESLRMVQRPRMQSIGTAQLNVSSNYCNRYLYQRLPCPSSSLAISYSQPQPSTHTHTLSHTHTHTHARTRARTHFS